MICLETERVTRAVYHCDCCGAKIGTSRDKIGFRFYLHADDGGIVSEFRYENNGDYCGTCLTKLYKAICRDMPVANRASLLTPSEHDKDVEIALIRTVKYDWEGK